MSDKTALGDRMKMYERAFTSGRSMPLVPTIARLDGKSFHTWTKGLDRPYDNDLIEIMQNVTKHLVEETNAVVGYTQSDEITLVFNSDRISSQIFFDGKLHKITSVLASMCTAFFNKEIENQSYKVHMRMNNDKEIVLEDMYKFNLLLNKPLAFFDCRVFQVPNKVEAINCLIWREQDATRNSIQMAGQANFSHSELHKKSTDDIQEMLFQQKGINWNNYTSAQKHGTYIRKVTRERKFTTDELTRLPEKHQAKSNPDLMVVRSDVEIVELPILASIQNRVDVIFNSADPITQSDSHDYTKEFLNS